MSGTVSLSITITGLTKRYGDVPALDGIDLAVHSGEFLTLLGPSGSGKTTLLMALAGFAPPDSGSIRFGDREMVLTPPHRRNVGMVFQSYALFPHMTVAGNVGYPLRLRKLAKAAITTQVGQALEMVDLAGYGDRRVHQLSGGQRQRVALARAIVFRPRILLMDEPLSALDKQLREKMQIELRRLHERLGMTTVYVTHDQREALTMSDRIAVIDRGRLMQLDAPRQIYERPASRFVADFIGESSFLRIERSGEVVSFHGRPLATAPFPNAAGPLQLMIRPERLIVLDGPAGDDVNLFEGRLRRVVYQGDSALAYVALADGTIVSARAGTGSGTAFDRVAPGDPLVLGLHRDDTVLVPNDGV